MSDTNDSNQITHWVSSIVNIESKSDENIKYLNSVLGPKTDLTSYSLDEEPGSYEAELTHILEDEVNQQIQNELKGVFMHQIVFKIDEKLFINKINIYEKMCPGSSLLKIEALQSSDNWLLLWETDRPQEASKPKLFTPAIKPTPFKTDTIRFTVCGSIYLIDGIEIKGNKMPVDGEESSKPSMCSLSRNLNTLIQNELFADVYFEVEGKIVPAHRNILVCRSEYFRAMLSSHGNFKESQIGLDPSKHPIYIKDLEHEIFMEILSYLYTGHVRIDDNNTSRNLLIGIMKAADKMNLIELGKLCLFHLSELIDEKNVVRIFKEASEAYDVLKDVIKLCYEIMSQNFPVISRSEDFCSLEQPLMLKVIENVIPKLARLTTSLVNGQQQEQPITIPPTSEFESSDSDDE